MTTFMQLSLSKAKLLIITSALTIIAALAACTPDDSLFGNNAIPPDQKMQTVIDSSITISTYQITVDSIVSSNVSQSYLVGRHTNPITGELYAWAAANFMPWGFPDDNYFGVKQPKVDSMTITLKVDYVDGDTSQYSKVQVFEIVDFPLHQDSLYYSNLNLLPHLNPTPLLEFETKSGGQYIKHLPMEYAAKFFDNVARPENIYNHDTLFHKKIHGLFFKVIPANIGEGTMLAVALANSKLYLYYNNKDDAAHPDTTLYQQYDFFSTNPNYEGFNTSLAMYKHDYSKADPAKGGVDYRVINDTINPVQKIFVSGPAGLGSKVSIPMDQLKQLMQNVKDKGYSTIGIHKAELIWEKTDKTWENYDQCTQQIVLYYNLSQNTFLPDYNYILESANMGYTSTMGGTLNRSLGCYKLDITRYMQSVITRGNKETNTQLFPSFDALQLYGHTIVGGSNYDIPEGKPKLVLIYTMLK